jgi:hypothetical protein
MMTAIEKAAATDMLYEADMAVLEEDFEDLVLDVFEAKHDESEGQMNE